MLESARTKKYWEDKMKEKYTLMLADENKEIISSMQKVFTEDKFNIISTDKLTSLAKSLTVIITYTTYYITRYNITTIIS